VNRRSGILCTAAALLPFVLTGCGPSSTGGAGRDVAAGANPAGQSWIVVAAGSAQPTPSASSAPSASAASSASAVAPARLAAEVPPRVVTVPASPGADVRPGKRDCVEAHQPGRIEIATVRPGRTTAAVTWYHPDDTSVVEYRVAAMSQALVVGRQPEIPWTVVEPGAGCHRMTATVSGLRPGTAYVFTVNAVRIRLSQENTYNVTVARSRAVVTGG
jgi:predicted small secreted protein